MNQTATATPAVKKTWGEKEILTDALNSEKYLCTMYQSDLTESATPEVAGCLHSIWNDQQHTAKRIYEEMSRRGWYPVEQAETSKVEQTKQKFCPSTTSGC